MTTKADPDICRGSGISPDAWNVQAPDWCTGGCPPELGSSSGPYPTERECRPIWSVLAACCIRSWVCRTLDPGSHRPRTVGARGGSRRGGLISAAHSRIGSCCGAPRALAVLLMRDGASGEGCRSMWGRRMAIVDPLSATTHSHGQIAILPDARAPLICAPRFPLRLSAFELDGIWFWKISSNTTVCVAMCESPHQCPTKVPTLDRLS